ncbi:MAG: hypothetical protein H7222_02515, partial [Methylotenera sp.]|nr:hypothetical protein [Oligoflexia bacterium]
HRADGLTLFNGDFFDLTPEQLGSVDAVYDRAALIAQPPEMRNRYALKLRDLLGSSLAQPEFSFLQIVLERFPHDEDGPPFSVRLTELEHLYGHDFAIHRLSEEMVEARAPAGSSTHESVLILAPLQKT